MYGVAKKNGHTEVCKQLQVFESGRIPQVRTISTQQWITVGSMHANNKIYRVYYTQAKSNYHICRKHLKVSVMLYLESFIKRTAG